MTHLVFRWVSHIAINCETVSGACVQVLRTTDLRQLSQKTRKHGRKLAVFVVVLKIITVCNFSDSARLLQIIRQFTAVLLQSLGNTDIFRPATTFLFFPPVIRTMTGSRSDTIRTLGLVAWTKLDETASLTSLFSSSNNAICRVPQLRSLLFHY